ncbi:MAG TPA: NAD(P)H-dependent oxidoreductase subunit E [Pseudonocardiaceae bacterium]|jgi:formate dehydrogenase subunit gamma
MNESVQANESVALAEIVRAIVGVHAGDGGPLLPILRDLHGRLGEIPTEAIALLATELNLSRADVHGVASFYRDLRARPGARLMVRICRAEACQARGAEALLGHARQRLGLDPGDTDPDRGIGLDQVFCLGNCALGPSVEINGAVHGRVDGPRLDELLAEANHD